MRLQLKNLLTDGPRRSFLPSVSRAALEQLKAKLKAELLARAPTR